MGVIVTRIGTSIDDCEDATDWTSSGSIGVNTTFQLEGSACLGEKVSAALGSENVYTFPGANPDMTNEFIVIPMQTTGKADTVANGGYRMIVEDGNGDRGTWYVGGDDTTTEKWTYFTVDPSTIPTNMNGSTNTAITYVDITSSGTTVTVDATGHGLSVGDYVVISEAVESGYNGSFPVDTVADVDTFTYIAASTPSASPATGSPTIHQGIDFTDVELIGVQIKTLTASLGNNENTFWDICWYGRGAQITSTIDSATITRSGTVATVSVTGHDLVVGDDVTLSGITDKTADNGTQTIVTVPGVNSYTYTTTDSGSTSYTGTILAAGHATFNHLAEADAAGFWGVAQQIQGVNFLQGQVVLGSDAIGDSGDLIFVDSNVICVFRENDFLPFELNNIVIVKELSGDITVVGITDSVFTAYNTSWAWSSSNTPIPNSINLSGCLIENADAVALSNQSADTYTNCTFNIIGSMLPSGSSLDGCAFTNWNADVNGSAFVWPGTNDIINTRFEGNAINIVMTQNTTQTFDNLTFDDFGIDVYLAIGAAAAAAPSDLNHTGLTAEMTSSGVHGLITDEYITVAGAIPTDYNGVFEVTVLTTTTLEYTMLTDPLADASTLGTWEETVVVNNTNGSNANSVTGAPGGTIDFRSSVPMTITVKDSVSLDAIQDAQTSIQLLASPFTQLMNEDTTAGGIATEAYSGTPPVDAVLKCRKSEDTDNPRYFADSRIVTITSDGLTATVLLEQNPFLQ